MGGVCTLILLIRDILRVARVTMETPGWLLALSSARSLLSTYYYNKWQRGWLMLGWFCGAPALFQQPQLSHEPHLRMLYLDAALLFLILAFLRQHGSLAHRHTMISDTALNRK
jgi:hypothetical protein